MTDETARAFQVGTGAACAVAGPAYDERDRANVRGRGAVACVDTERHSRIIVATVDRATPRTDLSKWADCKIDWAAIIK